MRNGNLAEPTVSECPGKAAHPKIRLSGVHSASSSPVSSARIDPAGDSQDGTGSYQYGFSPCTIPGGLHAQNAGALDWSRNGLLAYGCQNRVVVADTVPTLKFCQTLHRHKHVVTLVRWSPLTNHKCLCSIDTIGMIIVWDVAEATPLTVLLPGQPASFVHWIHLEHRKPSGKRPFNCWDLCREPKSEPETESAVESSLAANLYLLVFYPSTNTIVVYDADLGEPALRWQPAYQVAQIRFNPFFQFSRCCDSSVQNLLLAFRPKEEACAKIHLGVARLDEHHILSPGDSKEAPKISLPVVAYCVQNSAAASGSEKSLNRSLDSITRTDRALLAKFLFPSTDSSSSAGTDHSGWSASFSPTAADNQMIQMEFHRSCRSQIFLVFSREIYLIDLTLETIVTVIAIERNFSRIVQIFSCALRNAFYVLHETGNVSFRLYQKKVIKDNLNGVSAGTESDPGPEPGTFLSVGYVNLCHSESIRLTKQNKIFGFALSRFDEIKLAFLLSTGRILVKSLVCQNSSHPMANLSGLIKPQEYKLGAFSSSPGDALAKHTAEVKMIVTDYLAGLNCSPTVIRMCPPLTMQNMHQHRPFLAVGDALGTVQIWLLRQNTAVLHREFCVHSYAIAGIEWADLSSLITYSYPSISSSPGHYYARHPLSALHTLTGGGMAGGVGPGGSGFGGPGKVTNELVHLDIETGRLTPFRTNHMNDSSPIEMIRVSHLKQYLIILFKRDDPFEIWDLRTLTLLRVMSKSLGPVTAVEWSPIYSRKHVAKHQLQNCEAPGSKLSPPPPAVKECFIVTSPDLYHFSIEGTIIRELSRIPPDSESGQVNVTSIAWKSDQILFGDASGTLNLWDLKRKQSRTEATYRTAIKKVRFGPGRGNMKCLILYADYGVEIWDINEFRLCSQLKLPRDINFKIIDIDWANCDLPIFCTAEGFILVTDQKLKTYSSPMVMGTSPQLDHNASLLSWQAKKELIKQLMSEVPMLPGDAESSSVDIPKYIDNQLLLAKLFANQNDLDFWLLVSSILLEEELDSRLDLFLDNGQFRHLLQEKLMLLEAGRRTYFHACQVYKLNLHLRNFQQAVQVLLESESLLQQRNSGGSLKPASYEDTPLFYVDALKACLIAAIQTPSASAATPGTEASRDTDSVCSSAETGGDEPGSSQSVNPSGCDQAETKVAPVVKLVATSLIANGHIAEGVELLTIISKTADACRYLQSSERWLDSIWLAKASLDGNECTEIMGRWCEYLVASRRYQDQQTAMKAYLSRRQFSRVLKALNQSGDCKAFPFAVVCIGAQLIDTEANRDHLVDIFDQFVDYFHGQSARLQVKQPDYVLTGDDQSLRVCWNLFQQ